MPAPPAPAELTALAAQRAENREHFRAALLRIIDRGVAIVEALDPADGDPIATARAYHEVARDIRQGIMLADKLAAPIPDPPPIPPPDSRRVGCPSQPTTPATRTGTAPTPGGDPAESPESAETLERPDPLEALEPLEQLDDRPAEDVILDLRRSFGLLPTSWPRRALPTFEPRDALAATFGANLPSPIDTS